jgi:ATP-binding protein involved in chromosome partitioning
MKDRLTGDVTAAIAEIAPDAQVIVDLGVMTDDQRKEMQTSLRGGQAQREVPFAQAGSLTKVFAIASGKGGVGKSSVTVNLAMAMAARGLKVGLIDADIYGHSIPDMLGVGDSQPTKVEDMIMPVPVQTPSGTDIQAISIGMLKPRKDQVVAWRGPMLDRALVQMLSDVFWGDLDVLLLDLPPGTGDMAISLGQHLPNAEVVVVTTPQPAAASVAERAGTMASMLHQRVVGVIENMSYLDTGDGGRMELFGSGGAKKVAATLSERFGYDVSVLGEIPLDPQLREGGDSGQPIVASHPDSAAAKVLQQIADDLTGRARGLSGMQLGLSPAGR